MACALLLAVWGESWRHMWKNTEASSSQTRWRKTRMGVPTLTEPWWWLPVGCRVTSTYTSAFDAMCLLIFVIVCMHVQHVQRFCEDLGCLSRGQKPFKLNRRTNSLLPLHAQYAHHQPPKILIVSREEKPTHASAAWSQHFVQLSIHAAIVWPFLRSSLLISCTLASVISTVDVSLCVRLLVIMSKPGGRMSFQQFFQSSAETSSRVEMWPFRLKYLSRALMRAHWKSLVLFLHWPPVLSRFGSLWLCPLSQNSAWRFPV